MKKSTEVLGLKVMGIKEGCDKGVIADIVINAQAKKADYLILKDSRGYGFYGMNFSDLLGIGADYAVTASIGNIKKLYESKELLEAAEKGFYLMGATVLSSAGNIIGAVKDFSLDAKTGALDKVYLDNGMEFFADKILSLAGSTVFLALENEEFAPAQPSLSEIEESSVKFLLGKTVTSDVVSDDNAYTVMAGTELTQDVLNEAARHDLLLTLTLNV